MCNYLYQVGIIETLNVIGQCILVWIVLPELKSVLHSVAILTGVGLIPSILNIFNRPENEGKRPIQVRSPYFTPFTI